MNDVEAIMKIDVWSDIVCPFCTIGKRHLELALERFEHRDDVEIVWHSYELDPTIERSPKGTLVEAISRKYGIDREQSEASQRDIAARAAAVGLTFNWQDAKFGNTFDAHRLTHLAAARGLGDAAQQRLMRAYFTEGRSIGDPDELQRLGEEISLPAEDVRRVLTSDEHADAVRADEALARQIGITGVPFFVFDDTYGISGAQPVEMFERALEQVWSERNSDPSPAKADSGREAGSAPTCEGDACSV